MATKKLFNLLFGLFLFSMFCVSVNAALTFNSPTSGGNLSGTAIFNVTVPVADSGDLNFSCELYAKSSSTANSSWVTILSIGNDTGGAGNVNQTNASFASYIIEDSTDYSFNATCWNASELIVQTVITSVKIDNTVPGAASGLTPTSDTDGSFTFSGTVVGANVTSCTLGFVGINPGNPTYAMTHSGNLCTYAITGVAEQSYNWYIQASDGTNTSTSSTQTTSVVLSSGTSRSSVLLNSGVAEVDKKTGTLSIAGGDNLIKSGSVLEKIINWFKGLFS